VPVQVLSLTKGSSPPHGNATGQGRTVFIHMCPHKVPTSPAFSSYLSPPLLLTGQSLVTGVLQGGSTMSIAKIGSLAACAICCPRPCSCPASLKPRTASIALIKPGFCKAPLPLPTTPVFQWMCVHHDIWTRATISDFFYACAESLLKVDAFTAWLVGHAQATKAVVALSRRCKDSGMAVPGSVIDAVEQVASKMRGLAARDRDDGGAGWLQMQPLKTTRPPDTNPGRTSGTTVSCHAARPLEETGAPCALTKSGEELRIAIYNSACGGSTAGAEGAAVLACLLLSWRQGWITCQRHLDADRHSIYAGPLVAIFADNCVGLAAVDVMELAESAVLRDFITLGSVCESAFVEAATLLEQTYQQALGPQSCAGRPPCQSCGSWRHDEEKCTFQSQD